MQKALLDEAASVKARIRNLLKENSVTNLEEIST